MLEDELNARELKGIINNCKLLIGERTHSLIGAISCGVPIICLGSQKDQRTMGIVGDMCDLHSNIYDMQYPDSDELYKYFDSYIVSYQEKYEDAKQIKEKIKMECNLVNNQIKQVLDCAKE